MRGRFTQPLIIGFLLLCIAGALTVLMMNSFQSGQNTPAPSVSAAAAPPPTGADEAAVRQLALDWIHAETQSALDGNTAVIDKLAIPGSSAESNDSAGAVISHDGHKAFYVTRYDVDESNFRVKVSSGSASADLTYALWGHFVSWPDLKPMGPDLETPEYHDHFVAEKLNGRWLVGSVS